MARSHQNFAEQVLSWFDVHGRHDLPWQYTGHKPEQTTGQQNRSLYHTWVAEVMLQQTQVKTVIPYYRQFIKAFPSVKVLANSSLDSVLSQWAGLGYYSRARNLHKAALMILAKHAGDFPEHYEDVLTLPGIGPSTAGAILAQALNQPYAVLDGNVKRVLCRYHAIEGLTSLAKTEQFLWDKARLHTPVNRAADYTQAMMDLGATVCLRSVPKCSECPLQTDCIAYKTDSIANYPEKKPKKALPIKQVQMLIINDSEGAVLLEKRPPAGIWGGLWSLPETSIDEAVDAFCFNQLNLECVLKTQGDVFRHTFSHYHLDITPCWVIAKEQPSAIQEYRDLVWCQSDQLSQYGVAAPVSMLLQQRFESLDSKQTSRLNTLP